MTLPEPQQQLFRHTKDSQELLQQQRSRQHRNQVMMQALERGDPADDTPPNLPPRLMGVYLVTNLRGLISFANPGALANQVIFFIKACYLEICNKPNLTELARKGVVDGQIFQPVLLCLLGNRVKFTTNGSVALNAQWVTKRAAAEANAAWFCFDVHATDTGMSELDWRRFFRPFGLGDSSIAPKARAARSGMNCL